MPIVWLRVAREQSYRAHDETWRAESALERRVFDESLLDWMEIAPLGQTFDGGDRSPGRRIHRSDTRVLRLAVEQDRAGSAISVAAPIFGPCQAQVMARASPTLFITLLISIGRSNDLILSAMTFINLTILRKSDAFGSGSIAL